MLCNAWPHCFPNYFNNLNKALAHYRGPLSLLGQWKVLIQQSYVRDPIRKWGMSIPRRSLVTPVLSTALARLTRLRAPNMITPPAPDIAKKFGGVSREPIAKQTLLANMSA
jgi:hypothetical protein